MQAPARRDTACERQARYNVERAGAGSTPATGTTIKAHMQMTGARRAAEAAPEGQAARPHPEAQGATI
nr:MAG TPA: hypothetical protein [Caudoviricetes sp.]